MSASAQRQRILDNAVRILAEHGTGGLTVRAVAAASDCSTTGIYTYFGGKTGLLDAMYADGFTLFGAYVAEPDALPDPVERLVESCRRYWDWALAHPTQYQLMFVTAQARFEPSAASIRIAEGTFADLVARVRLVRTDLADEDVDDAAHQLWALLHGYVMLQLFASGTGEATAADRFERGVLALLRAENRGAAPA